MADYDMGGPWGFLDLGHDTALSQAVEQQLKLAKLQAKYGTPLPTGMQGLHDAVNSPCDCGCGTVKLAHATLCPPWQHLAGDHPSAQDPVKVQGWWQGVLPHAVQMAHEISHAYGVPVDTVLSPNLGTEADYVFQPHPDYGGYEVVGPEGIQHFATGAGPTIGIVGHPVLKKQGKTYDVTVTGWTSPSSDLLADVLKAVEMIDQSMQKPSYHTSQGVAVDINLPASALWQHDHTKPVAQAHIAKDGKVHIAPKDPELPDWVQKMVIASKAKPQDKGLAAFQPPDAVKVAWDGEHWSVLDNPTDTPVTGEQLDGLMSMAEPGIYWISAEAIGSAVQAKPVASVDPVEGGHAVQITPNGDGTWTTQSAWTWAKKAGKQSLSDTIQSLYLQAQEEDPWPGEQYEGTSIPGGLEISVEMGVISPEAMKLAFGFDSESPQAQQHLNAYFPEVSIQKGGITFPAPEPEPEPALFAEVGPEPDWCTEHQCHVTAAHPGDLVACISEGWIVPAAQKDGAAA